MASWSIREGLYPSNKSHNLPKVGLILMMLGYLPKEHVVLEHYIFTKLITNMSWMLSSFYECMELVYVLKISCH